MVTAHTVTFLTTEGDYLILLVNVYIYIYFFLIFIYLFIYLYLVVLGLSCSRRTPYLWHACGI